MGVIVANEKAASAIGPGMHGSTFGGGPFACRVALEFLDILEELLPSIRNSGAYFQMKLTELQRHFSFIPPTHYVFCGDKCILRADYLIDDLPRNLLRFEGQGLLYTAPHNHGATGFVRVNDWQEVAAYFAEIVA